MGSNSLVQRRNESGPAHGSSLSHHEAAPLPNAETRRKQNAKTSRPAASSLRLVLPAPKIHRLFSIVAAFFLFSSLVGTATAANGDRPTLLAVHVEDDLAWKGSSLYIDHRPPPAHPLLMPPLHNDDEGIDTVYTPPSKRALATDTSGGNKEFAVPEPLDTGLSNNFTTTCAQFLTRLRTNDTFKKCHPFSLMLQTSSGFFDASKSYLRITQTLDATCGVNATECKQTMDSFARELQSSSACKVDLDNDNPNIIQALNGLIAYPVAYQASCLRDQEGSYCFANAVSNTSSTTDSYPYYLPVGQELPAGSRPSCGSCLQDAMAVFAQYSNNATQPISRTYSTAAQQLSISCGRSFVNVTAAPLKAAATTTSPSFTPTMTLILMLVLYLFQ
ncbi:hypothetical protein FB567DRAFT_131027 [Paraphoma chrysanthemicola]|uniref:DUF7729 domain-containing protein n=1 Tax=Paraphoma chrysanthemicola TaxID=798071 RepID=A0A8K0VUR4_9PLEO|nr:hypothetical protein FB567DRAFT_131027 [Paraphoma chrysanthemicola]